MEYTCLSLPFCAFDCFRLCLFPLCPSVPVYLCLCLSVCLSVCLCLCVCVCVCVCVCKSMGATDAVLHDTFLGDCALWGCHRLVSATVKVSFVMLFRARNGESDPCVTCVCLFVSLFLPVPLPRAFSFTSVVFCFD